MTATRRAVVALAVVCGFVLGAVSDTSARSRRHRHHHKRSPKGEGGGSSSDGRSHLKRANALAGEGDCAAAIEEYTKAFEMLNDPVVLFNRAECYRRTGDGESAVDDYRAFLEKVPNAANRADIEAKIVALDVPEPAPREKPAAKPAPEPTPREKPAAEPAPAPSKAAEAPPPPSAPPPVPTPVSKPEPVVTVLRVPHTEEAGSSGGSRPWVWVALSVLVAGAAVAGYIMLRPADQAPPDSALGNYRL